MLQNDNQLLRKAELEDTPFIAALFSEPHVQANDLSMHGDISEFSLRENFRNLFHLPGWDRFLIQSAAEIIRYGIISARALTHVPCGYSVSFAITSPYQNQ